MTRRQAPLFALAVLAALSIVAVGCDDAGGDPVDETDSVAADTATSDDTTEPDAAADTEPADADTVEPDVEPQCSYPQFDTVVQLGKIMPHLWWDTAYLGDGTETAFDLEDFYCDDEAYGQYNTLVVFLVAEWCPACTEVLQGFDADRYLDRVDAAGGLVLIVEVETSTYVPATSAQGYASVSSNLTNHTGLIVGDGDTQPVSSPSLLMASPLVRSFPTGFVVRRDDMRVISGVDNGETFVDLEGMADDPDRFYMGPAPDTTTPNCGAAEEEPGEGANDVAAGAELVAQDTIISGGICNDAPDFWRIEERGNWLLDLDFDAQLGDLDFYLWDEANDTYLLDGAGRRIGSAETTPGEVFQSCGPALVRVFGYNGSTAPYTLTMTSLGGTSCN